MSNTDTTTGSGHVGAGATGAESVPGAAATSGEAGNTSADTGSVTRDRSAVAAESTSQAAVTGPRASLARSFGVRSFGARSFGAVPQALAPTVLAALLITFAVLSPSFLTSSNLLGVLNQNALLMLAAIAMTIVVRAGGIDLSIGVAIDLAALTASALLADDYVAWVAIAGGLLIGLLVGLVNAFLIVVLRIRPFLATLSVWFVGGGVQQVATDGGSPIYLSSSSIPDEFAWLGDGRPLGVAAPIVIALVVLVVVWAALERSRWGRVLTAAGEQPTATRIAGRLAGPSMASAFVIAAVIAAVAGIILASRSNGFVANSGQLYVLDSIGAVFVGTTLSRSGRANLFGTLVGVLIFALLANGMNLIGLSFYWQGLARGVVLLAILLLGVFLARERGALRPTA